MNAKDILLARFEQERTRNQAVLAFVKSDECKDLLISTITKGILNYEVSNSEWYNESYIRASPDPRNDKTETVILRYNLTYPMLNMAIGYYELEVCSFYFTKYLTEYFKFLNPNSSSICLRKNRTLHVNLCFDTDFLPDPTIPDFILNAAISLKENNNLKMSQGNRTPAFILTNEIKNQTLVELQSVMKDIEECILFRIKHSDFYCSQIRSSSLDIKLLMWSEHIDHGTEKSILREWLKYYDFQDYYESAFKSQLESLLKKLDLEKLVKCNFSSSSGEMPYVEIVFFKKEVI